MSKSTTIRTQADLDEWAEMHGYERGRCQCGAPVYSDSDIFECPKCQKPSPDTDSKEATE